MIKITKGIIKGFTKKQWLEILDELAVYANQTVFVVDKKGYVGEKELSRKANVYVELEKRLYELSNFIHENG